MISSTTCKTALVVAFLCGSLAFAQNPTKMGPIRSDDVQSKYGPEPNVKAWGAVPVDYAYQAGGTATGGTNIVQTVNITFPCTAAEVGNQLWLAASGTAAADTMYSITACSGNNYVVSPNVVTSVSAKAIAIGKQIDSSPTLSTLLGYCTSMSGNTQKGCTVKFPGMGTYVFLSTIQVSGYGPAIQKVRFECTGNEGGTQLVWAGADQGALIKVGSSTTNDFPSFEISNCTLAGIDPTAHRPDAIYLYSAGANTRIQRNHFANTYHGVRITNSFYWVVEHNYFQGSSASCIYLDSSGGSPNSNSTIRDNEINQCGGAATSPDGWAVGDFSGAAEDTLRIYNNDFEGNCCYNGMMRVLGSTPYIAGNRNETTGNCIQDGSWRDLFLSGGVFGHATVIGNEFFGGCGAIKGQYNVETSGGTNHTFVGNLYGNSTVTPVKLGNTNFVRFWETDLSLTSFTGAPDVLFGLNMGDNAKTAASIPGLALHGWAGVAGPSGQRSAGYISFGPAAGGGAAPAIFASGSPLGFPMIPTASQTGQTLQTGDIILNSYYFYGPATTRAKFPFWVARGTPQWNGGAWTGGSFDYGISSQCVFLDDTAAPASGTWNTCDFVRNTNPSTGIFGWLCTAGGTPGTWQAVYAIDPTSPPTWNSLKVGASGSTISDTRELLQNVHSCGTTTTCSNTGNGSYREIIGTVALSSGTPSTATVSSISPAFTSTTSYVCTLTNMTTQANPLKVVNTSTSSFTITGPNTVTDTVAYHCIGN